MMTIRIPSTLAFAILLATAFPCPAQEETLKTQPHALPNRFAALLEQAAEAEKKGQPRQVLNALQPLFQRATPEMLKLADSRLKQTYNLGQTVAELLVASRAQLALDGQSKRLPRPGKKELPLVMVDLADRAAKLQTPLVQELAVGFPALVPDPVIEEKLKDLVPLLSTAKQADALLAYLEQLTKQLRRSDRANLMGKAKEIAARDFEEEHKKLGTLRDALVERLVDFTLLRLNKAVDVLQDDNARFQDRFAAIERAADSLGTLHAHWEGYERSRSRSPQGLDPGVETGWQEKEAQFQQLAGPLWEKVYHYSEGTRWWLRGRYGVGRVAGGLAKAIPGRLPSGSPRVDRALEFLRDYPLQMPTTYEKPQDPLTDPLAYPIPRRHLEWWQFDTRVVGVRNLTDFRRPSEAFLAPTDSSSPIGTNRTSDRFGGTFRNQIVGISMDLVQEDLRLGRLVGYLEYLMALAHFDRLMEITTTAERKALEDMATEDDRFVVYSNISRKYDALDPASTLRLASRTEHPKAKSPWERRGLSWMMALARVELGAMRAGLTGESASVRRRVDNIYRVGKDELLVDSSGPFAKFPPKDFDRDAFLEVLWDAARQHYYESRTAYTVPILPVRQRLGVVLTQQLAVQLLLIDRKLTLAIELVEAFRHYAADRMSPAQQAELGEWLTWLDQQHGLVRGVLEIARVDSTPNAASQTQINEALKKAGNEQKQSPQ